MKKIMVVMVMILALTLSGCERTSDFINNVAEVGTYDSEENFTVVIKDYYTQEEVDELIQAEITEFMTEYNELLVMILLNDEDDYIFTIENGKLIETQISSGDIEEFDIDDIIDQALDELESD